MWLIIYYVWLLLGVWMMWKMKRKIIYVWNYMLIIAYDNWFLNIYDFKDPVVLGRETTVSMQPPENVTEVK